MGVENEIGWNEENVVWEDCEYTEDGQNETCEEGWMSRWKVGDMKTGDGKEGTRSGA